MIRSGMLDMGLSLTGLFPHGLWLHGRDRNEAGFYTQAGLRASVNYHRSTTPADAATGVAREAGHYFASSNFPGPALRNRDWSFFATHSLRIAAYTVLAGVLPLVAQ